MKIGDVVLLKNGRIFQIVGLPLTAERYSVTSVQFIDEQGGDLIEIEDYDIEEVSGSFASKLIFASQKLLHDRIRDLEAK